MENGIASPTVGTWLPSVLPGVAVRAGDVIGRILRHGAYVQVLAPKGVGVVGELTPSGTWVAYSEPLIRWGEANAALVAEESVALRTDGALAVRAETDGTVYQRPSPDQPSFAVPGQVVDARATVALVEVMKTFTPVRSPVAGTVVGWEVEDGESVSEGDPILWIKPSA